MGSAIRHDSIPPQSSAPPLRAKCLRLTERVVSPSAVAPSGAVVILRAEQGIRVYEGAVLRAVLRGSEVSIRGLAQRCAVSESIVRGWLRGARGVPTAKLALMRSVGVTFLSAIANGYEPSEEDYRS